MTCGVQYSQFELVLHSDILQDLSVPDKLFSYELPDIQSVGGSQAGIIAGRMPCVQLTRVQEGLVKLCISRECLFVLCCDDVVGIK